MKTKIISITLAFIMLFSVFNITAVVGEGETTEAAIVSKEPIPEYLEALQKFEELQNAQQAAEQEISTEEVAEEEENMTVQNNIEPLLASTGEEIDPIIPESSILVKSNDYENVSIIDNSLSFTYPVISLKGKAGLDLNLNLNYNSTSAVYDVDGRIGKPQLYNPIDLPIGWSFSVPWLSSSEKYIQLPSGERISCGKSNFTTYYLRDAVGGRKKLTDIYLYGSQGFLKGYRFKDGSSVEKETVGGLSTITYRDKYGNTITYQYSSSGRLTSITDSLGRIINFVYATNSITVKLGNDVLTTIYTSKKTINSSNSFEYVTSIENSLGDAISFGYQKINGNWPCEYSNTYSVNLNKITYPTGGISNYTYDDRTKYIGEYTSYKSYNVTERTIEGTEAMKTTEYSFITTNVSGSSWRHRTATSMISENNGEKITDYTFDTYGNVLTEKLTTTATLITTTCVYNQALLMTSRTIIVGTNEETRTTETWDYDAYSGSYSYGDLQEYTDQFGNVTTYTYFNENPNRSIYEYYIYFSYLHLPKSQQYTSVDGLHSYTINNTLTADELSIEKTTQNAEGIITTTDYMYDSCGQMTSTTYEEQGKGSITKEYVYNYTNKCALPTQTLVKNVKTYNENFEEYTYDNKKTYTYDIYDRQLTESVYPDGAQAFTTTCEYYADGKIKKVTAPDTSKVEYVYTLVGNGESANSITKTATGTNGGTYVTKDICDGFGFITYQQEKNASGTFVNIAQYNYENGRLHDATDQCGVTTIYDYDGLDGVTKVTYPDSTFVSIVYDDANMKKTIYDQKNVQYTSYCDKYSRLSKEETINEGRTIKTAEYGYDWQNNVNKAIDANGAITESYYDSLGRLEKVKNALGQETAYEYGISDNVTKMTTYGGSVFQYKYDTLGNVIETTDALGQKEYFAYNRLGNQTKAKDKNGVITSTEYKANTQLPQRIEKTLAGTQPEGVAFVYDGFGRLTQKTNIETNSTIGYTYRYNSQLETVTTDGKTLTYAYNTKYQVSGVTDYYGNTTAYEEYDVLGRVKKITQDGVTVGYNYTPTGMIDNISYGNILSVDYDYYDSGNVKTMENKKADGTRINEYSYLYDDLGNQISKVETTPNGIKAESYVYDALSRLKTVTAGINKTEYAYDNNNNIKTIQETGSVSSVITNNYDLQNRLLNKTKVSGTTTEMTEFSYDNVGNIYSERKSTIKPASSALSIGMFELGSKIVDDELDGTKFYSYNKNSQLTEFRDIKGTYAKYTYNADGLRESKTIGSDTTKYYYNGSLVSNESKNGAESATNLLGLGSIIGRVTDQGSAYFVKNGHGDVTKLLDTNSNVIADYDYDVWGKQKAETGTFDNPIRYSGEYFDQESGNIYLRARYYDPEVERFISEDPIKSGMNWYVYCSNNPINFVDPSGQTETADKQALIDGTISQEDYDKIEAYTVLYNSTTDYAVKIAIRLRVIQIRNESYAKGKYKDNFDYTFGGKYDASKNKVEGIKLTEFTLTETQAGVYTMVVKIYEYFRDAYIGYIVGGAVGSVASVTAANVATTLAGLAGLLVIPSSNDILAGQYVNVSYGTRFSIFYSEYVGMTCGPKGSGMNNGAIFGAFLLTDEVSRREIKLIDKR